jgi:leucyl-tRNA---protein transferase
MPAHEPNLSHRLVDEFLASESLPISDPFNCPYLPDHQARSRGFTVDQVDADIYTAFMDRGFRRSGNVIYRPACDACQECRQIRIPVESFRRSRSQRRVCRQNNDIRIERVDDPVPTPEKWRLFKRYLDHQHDGTMPGEWDEFVRFLYKTPVETVEFVYKLGTDVIAISIVDLSHNSLSSVYMYFDPNHAHRSLGTFSIVWEIEYCRIHNLPYYYLGYFIKDSRTMAYKARFRPYLILENDMTWTLHND